MEREQIEASDWSDVDLLTRDEAAERLDGEVEKITARLAGETEENAETEQLRQRLSALRTALENLRTSTSRRS